MTDDIVTRLRAYNIGNIAHEASSPMEEMLYEAADEIERLRNKLETYRNILNMYNATCDCDGCAACCQYELVVRSGSTN